MSICYHIRTEPHLSDLRRCLDCSETLTGRQLASVRRPDFLTEADYGITAEQIQEVNLRIAAALTEGLEPGCVMSTTAIRQAQKSPTLRRLFA